MKIFYFALCASLLASCADRSSNNASETEAAAKVNLPISKPGSEYKWILDEKKLTGELFLDGKSIFKGKIIEGIEDSPYVADFINSDDPSFMCGSFMLVYGPNGFHDAVWRWPGTDWPGAENIHRKRCEPTFAGADGEFKGKSPTNDGVLTRIVGSDKDHK